MASCSQGILKTSVGLPTRPNMAMRVLFGVGHSRGWKALIWGSHILNAIKIGTWLLNRRHSSSCLLAETKSAATEDEEVYAALSASSTAVLPYPSKYASTFLQASSSPRAFSSLAITKPPTVQSAIDNAARVGISFGVAPKLVEQEDLSDITSNHKLDILYEDADLIAVDKPNGLAMHFPSHSFNCSKGNDSNTSTLQQSVKEYLARQCGKRSNVYAGIVHYLDTSLSGVCLFTKNSNATLMVNKATKAGYVERVYVCLVHGHMKQQSGQITRYFEYPSDQPLCSNKDSNSNIHSHTDSYRDRDSRRNVSRSRFDKEVGAVLHNCAVSGAFKSTIRYETISEFELDQHCYSLLQITHRCGGRKGQIRAQLASAGHPIIGDAMYSFGYSSKIDSYYEAHIGKGKESMALHSLGIYVPCPRDGKNGNSLVGFQMPPPVEWASLIGDNIYEEYFGADNLSSHTIERDTYRQMRVDKRAERSAYNNYNFA